VHRTSRRTRSGARCASSCASPPPQEYRAHPPGPLQLVQQRPDHLGQAAHPQRPARPLRQTGAGASDAINSRSPTRRANGVHMSIWAPMPVISSSEGPAPWRPTCRRSPLARTNADREATSRLVFGEATAHEGAGRSEQSGGRRAQQAAQCRTGAAAVRERDVVVQDVAVVFACGVAEPFEQPDRVAVLGEDDRREARDPFGARPVGESLEQCGSQPAMLPVIGHHHGGRGHLGCHAEEARDTDAGAVARVERQQRLVVVVVEVGQVGQPQGRARAAASGSGASATRR
jgi:hypothetical protein